MLQLDDILEMWKKDSEINDLRLDDSSRDTAKLHAKYLEILMHTKLKLKKSESNLQILLKDKWLYYNGKMSKEEMDNRNWDYDPFNGLSKPLKGDMDYFYNSDVEIVKANDQIQYLKTIVETLEEIISNLKWRHQTIKNMIDWRRFESGV